MTIITNPISQVYCLRDLLLTYAIREMSTPLYAPFSMSFAFPPPFSSAGVPNNCVLPGIPNSFSTADKAKNATILLVAIKLWPQAWPISGRASYSALKFISGPKSEVSPPLLQASKEVSRPYAWRVTSKPWDSRNVHIVS